MAGEGRIRQIYEARSIDGVSKNPGADQDGKFWRFDNNTETFEYVLVGDGGDSDINTTYFTTFVTDVFNGLNTDDYLSQVDRVGDYGRFTLNSGTYYDLELGELAWLDTIPPEKSGIVLPGDTKVLFDDSSSIAGNAAFTYNKTSNKLQFQGTGIVFDLTSGTEGTYKEGIKYTGNYSWSIGNGINTTSSGQYNITSGYKAGSTLGGSSLRNAIYGPFAGELMGSALEGSIYIGPYSGRYETASNKLFIDNIDHGDTAAARTNSFIYADLDVERRLYVRDRLSVEKEGKFGTSGLTDAQGEYGMYQMSAASGGVPQWHDGSVWQSFANSTNTYLSSVSYTDTTGETLTKTGELLFTLSDTSTVGPIDLDLPQYTFATSPSSPATGKTAISNYGYLQISNSSFNDNEGFTHRSGFYWQESSDELFVPGAVHYLTLVNDTGLTDNSIWTDGTNFYGKLAGTSIQLNNDPAIGESIDGVNIGGATYEVFKQRTDDDLEFRTFKNMPIGTNNPNDRIKFSYSTDGDAIFVGTTAEKNRLDSQPDAAFSDVAIDRDNDGETLLMRVLRPGTGVTLTQNEEYILIDATGAGGGEVNTMNNNGTGIEFYGDKIGAQFKMYTLSTTDSRITLTQATDYTTDPENTINLDLTISGNNSTPSSGLTYSGGVYNTTVNPTGTSPTITLNTLVSDTISIDDSTVPGEIRIEYGTASEAAGTNLGTGIELYSDGTAPDFEYKTFTADNNHLTVSANADGNHIDIDVDDISINDLGTDDKLLYLDVDNWTINQKGLAVDASTGLSLDAGLTTFTIAQDKEIVDFDWSTITQSYSGGLLEFKVDYSDDIRSVGTLTSTTIAQINIGDGLSYDNGTNTLSANVSGTIGTDNYLVSITDDFTNSNFADLTELQTGSYLKKTYSIEDGLGNVLNTIDSYVSEYTLPVADYTTYLGSSGIFGGVKVEQYSASWVLNSTTPLSLDEVTGKIAANKLIVTYEQQNNLHDTDNVGGTVSIPPSTTLDINTLRANARANIGSAYVNGNSSEDFNSNNNTVAGTLSATASNTHSIGKFEILDGTIKGNSAATQTIWKSTDSTSTYIKQTGNSVDVLVGKETTSRINIYSSTGTKLFAFDADNGDLYVAGNIYAGGDIEGGDTDNLPSVGITPIP